MELGAVVEAEQDRPNPVAVLMHPVAAHHALWLVRPGAGGEVVPHLGLHGCDRGLEEPGGQGIPTSGFRSFRGGPGYSPGVMTRHRIRAFVVRNQHIIAIMGVGFVIRVGWLLHAHPQPVSDFQVYQQLAINLLDKGFFGIDAPDAVNLPGFPSLLAGLILLSRSVWFLSFAMVVLSTTACLLVYLLGLRLTGRRQVALVAAGAFALNPTFILYSSVLGTEHLFTLLVIGTLLMTLSLRDGATRTAFGVGALLGIAVLTRGEAVFYIPVIAAFVWFADPTRSARSNARLSAVVLLALVLVTAPWVIRNAIVVDAGVTLSTVGGINFYFAHNPDHYGWTEDVPWPPGAHIEANRMGWELGLEYLKAKPMSILESTRDGTYHLFGAPSYALFWATQQPDSEVFLEFEPRYVRFEGVIGKLLTTGGTFLLSMAAASFLTWRTWSRRLRIVLPAMILCNWLGYAVLFFGHPRFRYTLDAVVMVLVGITIVALTQAIAPVAGATGPPSLSPANSVVA